MTTFSGSASEFVQSWRYFIWAIVLGLAIALFYVEEDWRGHWTWQRYQRRMNLKSESVDFSAFVPPRVPDDKNFAMTPFLEPLFDFIPGSQKWAGPNPMQTVGGFAPKYDAASRELEKVKTVRSNSWVKAPTDLPAWYCAFLKANTNHTSSRSLRSTNLTREEAAKGVLSELSECDGVLDEVQAASQLPYSRFNLRYEEDNPAGILLPHLAVLKHLCQVLSLRASARLALGHTEPAFRDIMLMLFLADANRNEPMLIAQLVRMTEVYIALQPLAEGIGQWSEPQLRQLEERLGHFDFLADAERNLTAERAWGCAIIDYVGRSKDKNGITGQQSMDFGAVLMTMAPEGWLDLEKLHYCRVFQQSILPTIDLPSRRIDPGVAAAETRHITALNSSSWPTTYLRHRFFIKLLLPAMDKFARKAAFGQTAVDTAMLACALERYRQAHSRVPEALEALTPQFIPTLPHDIITGQPLKYRQTGHQHYILYSVAWNGVDDGGLLFPAETGEDIASEKGDWVWQLPDVATDH